MQSWRMLFSRSNQMRKLDIRRFDFHHQFHSFVQGDHSSSFHRHSILQSVSLVEKRFQTTKISGDRIAKVSTGSTYLEIDAMLHNLSENVKKGEFGKFDKTLDELSKTVTMSKVAMTQNQTQQLISSLKEWNKENHSEREYARVFKSMADLRISPFRADQEKVIISIVDKCLVEKQQSFRWFAVLLTGLRKLNNSGSLLQNSHRQRILESLSELKKDSHEIAYNELLSGIVGLRINWDEISETGKLNLLNQLKALLTKFTPDFIYSVIFNFGKLGVNLKETGHKKTIIELARKAFKQENGKGKLDTPRAVSL
jgi:hypothetical protein